MPTYGVILAAGLSSRMGALKPLLSIGKLTMIERCVATMTAAGVAKIVVVVGHCGDQIKKVLQASQWADRLYFTEKVDPHQTDMLYSIRLGLNTLAQLPPCDNFFLVPGDMPLIAPATYQKMRQDWVRGSDQVLFATYQGRRKHPVLIADDFRAHIMAYQGGCGLRGLWQQVPEQLRDLPVDDLGCAIDIDTQQDFKSVTWIMNKLIFS